MKGGFQLSGHVNAAKEGNLIKRRNTTITIPIYVEPGVINIKDKNRSTGGFDISGTYHNDLLSNFYKKLDAVYPYSYASEELYKASQNNRIAYMQQYIQTHKNSLITLQLYRNSILNSQISEEDKLLTFNSINKSIRNTYGGKEIFKKLNQLINTAIGKMAPSFILPDTLNKNIALQNFRGKYVLLDFWAS